MKKMSFQKIFCFISFLFILSCCIFFGTRFIKLYLANKKEEIMEKNSLVKVLKENNQENDDFKSVNGENYFTNKTESNYLLYSGILWRIIKLNSDNSLTAISDKAITSLAYGIGLSNQESHIYNWLNKSDKEYSGILEKSLNNEYLQKTPACNDIIDELSNNPCKDINTDNYYSLLSVTDYLNIGSKNSYLANNEIFYLNNQNSENKIWYVDDSGNGKLSPGNDIIGVRPVITIKSNVDYISGNGTNDNPYIIEKENSLFGSYVKLGNDIWRIYEVNGEEIKLMLNDYLKVNGDNLKYKYSNNSSYHDDTVQGSIAYYLNNTYLNSLSYKDIIKEIQWPNGYYNSNTNYDYTNAIKSDVNTKVALMSVSNIFLNQELNNYYTMTGTNDKSSSVYVTNANKRLSTKYITSTVNVVPTICIDKSKLTKGNGTIDSPLEME